MINMKVKVFCVIVKFKYDWKMNCNYWKRSFLEKYGFSKLFFFIVIKIFFIFNNNFIMFWIKVSFN